MGNYNSDNKQSTSKAYTFEDLLDQQGYFVYTNMGCSMMPLLRQQRDLIVIRKKGAKRCRKYDVTLYKFGDRYILHRVLKVLTDGYLIAGDNCHTMDPFVKEEQILGVMTSVKRNGREISVDDPLYKLYVHLWCDVYPVRMLALRSARFLWHGLKPRKHKSR